MPGTVLIKVDPLLGVVRMLFRVFLVLWVQVVETGSGIRPVITQLVRTVLVSVLVRFIKEIDVDEGSVERMQLIPFMSVRDTVVT